jgi:hypothetical protein
MLRKRQLKVNKLIDVKNVLIYSELKRQGWQYILNPDTDELHDLQRGNYVGSHNLRSANLERFFPIVDAGQISIRDIKDGEEIELYDFDTGQFLRNYVVKKCDYCF